MFDGVSNSMGRRVDLSRGRKSYFVLSIVCSSSESKKDTRLFLEKSSSLDNKHERNEDHSKHGSETLM